MKAHQGTLVRAEWKLGFGEDVVHLRAPATLASAAFST